MKLFCLWLKILRLIFPFARWMSVFQGSAWLCDWFVVLIRGLSCSVLHPLVFLLCFDHFLSFCVWIQNNFHFVNYCLGLVNVLHIHGRLKQHNWEFQASLGYRTYRIEHSYHCLGTFFLFNFSMLRWSLAIIGDFVVIAWHILMSLILIILRDICT